LSLRANAAREPRGFADNDVEPERGLLFSGDDCVSVLAAGDRQGKASFLIVDEGDSLGRAGTLDNRVPVPPDLANSFSA